MASDIVYLCKFSFLEKIKYSLGKIKNPKTFIRFALGYRLELHFQIR